MSTIPTITLNNGVRMPQLGFGVFQVPDEQTTAAVRTAIDAGYRSIDTAVIYGNESGVGRAVAESGVAREELFLTSKLWNSDQGYDSTLRAYDATVARLGVDHLDLYLIHWPSPARALFVDSWRALESLYRDGRVRAIGVSNFQPSHLDILTAAASIAPAINQIELHPALRNRAVEDANARLGIVTEAWSPLAQGAILAESPVLQASARHGKTPAQVVLRWHLQQGRVVIPKSVTPARIAENLGVFDFDLGADEIHAIDALDREGRTGPHPDTFEG